MEIASLFLLIHDNGSNLFKRGITPAEATILATIHQANVKAYPLVDIVVTGKASVLVTPATDDKPAVYRDRTDKEELARLRAIYKKDIVNKLYPGLNPKLPATFEEIKPAPVVDLKDETAEGIVFAETPLPEPVKVPEQKSGKSK